MRQDLEESELIKKNNVQSAQTKAARVISGTQRWGQNPNRIHRQELFNNIGWLNVSQLAAQASLNLVKTALERRSSPSINNLFRMSLPIHPRGIAILRADFVGKIN